MLSQTHEHAGISEEWILTKHFRRKPNRNRVTRPLAFHTHLSHTHTRANNHAPLHFSNWENTNEGGHTAGPPQGVSKSLAVRYSTPQHRPYDARSTGSLKQQSKQ